MQNQMKRNFKRGKPRFPPPTLGLGPPTAGLNARAPFLLQRELGNPQDPSSRCQVFLALLNWTFLLAAAAAIILEAYLLAFAQPDVAPADAPAVVDAAEEEAALEQSVCAKQLKGFLAEKRVEFGQFLNTHFRSSKPTSELTAPVIELFRQYRSEAQKKVDGFLPLKGATGAQAATETKACEQAMKDDFTVMKELIRNHILENAYAKKSTRMLDKYKEINSKLEKLNFTIAQMYGNFAALSQKLPCYATKCVKQ